MTPPAAKAVRSMSLPEISCIMVGFMLKGPMVRGATSPLLPAEACSARLTVWWPPMEWKVAWLVYAVVPKKAAICIIPVRSVPMVWPVMAVIFG